MVNSDTQPHQFVVRGDSGNPWGQNPAWMDPTQSVGDNLVAGYSERADRVLVFGAGADAYSLQPDGLAPGYNRMVLVFNLKPGEKRVGWFVRPYNAFAADLPELRKHDWAKEWEQCKKEWHDLLDRALKLSIPDAGVTNAYLACLGDLFIMREPMSNGLIGNVVGTEQYRSSNPFEPAIVAVALDQNGMHKESAAGYKVNLDMQKSDGNWADYQGWAHLMWGASGFKCWAIMEHYRLTGDKQYLAEMYPRMIASSRFQERQRARMRPAEGEKPHHLRSDAARHGRWRTLERRRSLRRLLHAQHLGGVRRPMFARSGRNSRQDRATSPNSRRSTRPPAPTCWRPSIAAPSVAVRPRLKKAIKKAALVLFSWPISG